MQVKTLGYCLLLGVFFVLVYFAFLRGDSAAEEERAHILRQLQIQVEQIPAFLEDLKKLERQNAALEKVIERSTKEGKEREEYLKELERTSSAKQKELLGKIEALKKETTEKVYNSEDRVLKSLRDQEELVTARLKEAESRKESELLLKVQSLELALELSNKKLAEMSRTVLQLPDSNYIDRSVYSSTEAVLSSRLSALKKDLGAVLADQVASHVAQQVGEFRCLPLPVFVRSCLLFWLLSEWDWVRSVEFQSLAV